MDLAQVPPVENTNPGAQSIYKPLPTSPKAIRLLVLLPSLRTTDQIKGHLCAEYLENGPQYEALSYTWGDPENTIPILLDGNEFPVTENLFHALRHLRFKERRPRVLWVDAICINQAAILERNQQVSLMGEIYTQAQEVLVWLGLESNTSAKAVKFLQLFPALLYGDQANRQVRASPDSFAPTYPGAYKLIYDTQYADGWEALGFLLARPWFQRAWVVQEVALASKVTVLCGNLKITWETIDKASTSIGTARVFLSRYLARRDSPNRQLILHTMKLWGSINSTLQLRSSRQGTRYEPAKPVQPDNLFQPLSPEIFENVCKLDRGPRVSSLIELLEVMRGQKSSDARDKVYAVLSLLHGDDETITVLTPDYSQSAKFLYSKVAKRITEKYKNLDLLSSVIPQHHPSSDVALRASESENALQDLPSWVPDWRYKKGAQASILDQEYYGGDIGWSKFFFGAATRQTRPFEFEISEDYSTLTVTGVIFDSIKTIGTLQSDKNFEPCILEWKEMIQANSTADYIGEEPVLQEFWRTVLGDRWLFKDDRAINCRLTELVIEGISWIPPRSIEEQKRLLAGMETNLPQCCSNKRFFISSRGYFGLAPSHTIVGDAISMLVGGAVPYILRPCQGKFELIGESYVHLAMDGEKELEKKRGCYNYTSISIV